MRSGRGGLIPKADRPSAKQMSCRMPKLDLPMPLGAMINAPPSLHSQRTPNKLSASKIAGSVLASAMIDVGAGRSLAS